MAKCPTGKIRLPSEAVADRVRKRMKNSLLDSYQCRECRGWHVGRSRDPDRAAQRIGEVLDKYNAALALRISQQPAQRDLAD